MLSATNIYRVFGINLTTLLELPRCTVKSLSKFAIEYITGNSINADTEVDDVIDDDVLAKLGFPVIRS